MEYDYLIRKKIKNRSKRVRGSILIHNLLSALYIYHSYTKTNILTMISRKFEEKRKGKKNEKSTRKKS